MAQTGAHIYWPAHLPISKHKKDPYIKIKGQPKAVHNAKELVSQTLESETHTSKVILKMDVPYTEHPHMIGRGGQLIKKVMEFSKCHIHFPDGNTTGQCVKSNQVSIAGEPVNIEKARLLMRALLPVVISFDVPLLEPFLQTTAHEVQLIQKFFGLSIYFKRKEKLGLTTVYIRCTQSFFPFHKQGILAVMDYICGTKSEFPVCIKTEILPPHQTFVAGTNGRNINQIMLDTSTNVRMPDRNAPDPEKDVVLIYGSLDNAYTAWQEIMNYLPLMVVFDVGEKEVNADCGELFNSYDVNIYTRSKSRSTLKTITIKGPEKFSKRLLQFRQDLLKLPTLDFVSDAKEINLASALFSLSLDSSSHPYMDSSFVSMVVSNVLMTREMFWSMTHYSGLLQGNVLGFLKTDCTTALGGPISYSAYSPTKCDSCGHGFNQQNETNTTDEVSIWKSTSPSSIQSHKLSFPENGKPAGNTNLGKDQSSCTDNGFPNADYYHKKVLATQAMHRNIGSEQSMQVPSTYWAGCGFSQSMPAAVIKQNLEKGHFQNSVSPDKMYPDTCSSTEIWNSDISQNVSSYDEGIWCNKKDIFSYSNCFDVMSLNLKTVPMKDLLPKLLFQAGLDKYIDVFKKEEIDYEAFLLLSDEDLKSLGVCYGARTKMISLIRQMQKRDWDQRHDNVKKSFEAAPGAERKLNV